MNPPRSVRFAAAGLVLALLAACSARQAPQPGPAPASGMPADAPPAHATPADPAPAARFLQAIAAHCGKAYAGRITADTPPTPNDPFSGKPLVMHVRECSDAEIRIPFHVGDDRSRTWVLTPLEGGRLRLKHDHRHADGSPDAVTLYGGDTAAAGSTTRQAFPVDADSVAMFQREGLSASLQNTWAMEIHPERFVYELSRPSGRLFRVEFDLTRPVAPPPPPWGSGA